jgi:adenylate cyclase
VPDPRPDHALRAVVLALDMRDLLRFHQSPVCPGHELRIHINSGLVVAGVIGTKCFLRDLWGDAVNTASRMPVSNKRAYVGSKDGRIASVVPA